MTTLGATPSTTTFPATAADVGADASGAAAAAQAASWPATTAFDATVPAAVGTAATGSAAKAAHRDHVHPTGAGTPTTQAFGDAAAVGTGPAAAMTDHKHAFPALGTTAAAIGTSAGGSATTPSKSDHVHATGAGTPSTQAFGDAAATGTGPAAAMTDHKHAMMANPAVDLVQVTSGAGSIVIPGLKGSPDIAPGGSGNYEFDDNSAGVPSGWTSVGNMNTPNTTDARSHLHLRKQTTDTTMAALYLAIAATRPLILTAKITAWGPGLTFGVAGIVVAEATPGKLACFGVQRFAAATTGAFGGVCGEYTTWTVFGTRATNSSVAWPRPTAGTVWVKVTITTDTNIAYALSPDGLIYNTIASGLNPGFTLGQVGLGLAAEGAADIDAYFDYLHGNA